MADEAHGHIFWFRSNVRPLVQNHFWQKEIVKKVDAAPKELENRLSYVSRTEA